LLSLPLGVQAREIVGHWEAAGDHPWALWQTECLALLEAPEALDAATVAEDQAEAKAETELPRPGLTIYLHRLAKGERPTAVRQDMPQRGRIDNAELASRPT
jgi:hypothetical protein